MQGLTGNAEQKLFNALSHTDIPRRGDSHPTIPFIRVGEISASPIDADTIEVSVIYRFLDAAELPPDESADQGLVQIGSYWNS